MLVQDDEENDRLPLRITFALQFLTSSVSDSMAARIKHEVFFCFAEKTTSNHHRPARTSPVISITTNACGRSPETRLGGALRYWRRISNGGCDTTQPGRGSGSCPISKRTHEGKTLTPTTRRRRGGGRIETHREDAEGLISHAGDGGKRSTCCTAPAVCRCAVVVGWD